MKMGDSIQIVDGFYSGCFGKICKMPDPEDMIDYKEKWEEACGGDGYTGTMRDTLVDHFHVLLESGTKITFLQPEDLKSM